MATQSQPWRSPIALTSLCAILLAASPGSPSLDAVRSSNSLLPAFGLTQTAQQSDRERAQQLNQQAIELYRQGRYAEAIPLVEQALAIQEKVLGAQHVDTIESLNNLAWLYNSVSRYGEAETLLQRLLALHRQLGNRAEEGTILNNIGEVYRQQGNYTQALDYYQQSLKIDREVGNRGGEGITLNNIGGVYYTQGN